MSVTESSSRIEEIGRLIREKSDEVQMLYQKSGDDPRRDDFQRVITLNKEQDDLMLERKELLDAQNEWSRLRSEHDERRASFAEVKRTVPYEAAIVEHNGITKITRKRIADQFFEDAELKSFLDKIRPGGAATTAPFGMSPAVALKNLLSNTAPTAGQSFGQIDYQPDVMRLGKATLNIRDFISVRQTNQLVVSWVEQTSRTNNAVPWPEPVDAATATAKPESALNFTSKTTNVKIIPTWIAATRMVLDDVPAMRSIIEDELPYMLDEELESQIVIGDGTGNNFRGLQATTGYTPQVFATDMVTTARKAITAAVVTARVTPTGFLMNPADWEAIDLSKSSQGIYYFGGPQQQGVRTLWGLPVGLSVFIPAGTAYTGALRNATLWDREQATMYMTDSHSDWFTKNLLAFLVELRAAFAVRMPAQIVQVQLKTPWP